MGRSGCASVARDTQKAFRLLKTRPAGKAGRVKAWIATPQTVDNQRGLYRVGPSDSARHPEHGLARRAGTRTPSGGDPDSRLSTVCGAPVHFTLLPRCCRAFAARATCPNSASRPGGVLGVRGLRCASAHECPQTGNDSGSDEMYVPMVRRAAIAVVTSLMILSPVAPTAGASGEATCPIHDLSLRLVLISAPTGLPRTGLQVTNRSNSRCTLHGYPLVSLRDRRGMIPFIFKRVPDPMPLLVLRKGGSAYVVVSKFRCDLKPLRSVTKGEVWLAGHPGARLSFVPHVGIGLCRPDDGGEAYVKVTPFEPTVRAALSRA